MAELWSRIQRFDMHTKYLDTVQQRTITGAVLTIAAGALMVMLFVSEFLFYQQTHMREVLRVDDTLGTENITISFHFAFPRLECAFLNVDAEDAQGTTQIGVSMDVMKRSYDFEKDQIMAKASGCDVQGRLRVHKVAGNFRIALGRAQIHGHDGHAHTVYQFNVEDLKHFNASHTIKHLAFGPEFPGMHNGLDGVAKVVQGVAQFKYYVKLVPTQYKAARGDVVESNQYSFSEHFQDVQLGSGSFPHPGVFFKYEFAPVKVHVEEYKRTFLQFFTSVCAIVGGLFTVAGMLDGCLYSSQQALKKLS